MSRPRTNYPDDVSKAIDGIIREFQDTGDIFVLSDFHVADVLNIGRRTLDKYYDGEADKALQDDPDTPDNIKAKYKNSGYCDAIKRLVDFRSAICQQQMCQGKNIPAWIFLSKQGRYGGFQDVQRGEQSVKADFRITLTGPDGKTVGG